MHLRRSHVFALAGVLIALAAAPAAAQSLADSDNGFQEWKFGEPAAGSACAAGQSASDDNIVWGTAFEPASCATAADEDNIVWGTLVDDNIVWGTLVGDENIVWGTALDSAENIVWGTSRGDDNIVWGTVLEAPADAYGF